MLCSRLLIKYLFWQGKKGEKGDTGSDGRPGNPVRIIIVKYAMAVNVLFNDLLQGPKGFVGFSGEKGDIGNMVVIATFQFVPRVSTFECFYI